jgi:AcrR family transcriptional regulator
VPREVRIPQIAQIAEELFGQFGYQGTSMDDVARLAGVSKPVVYDVVGSKDELFKLCLARSADELAARVAAAVEGAPEPDRLRAGALAFFLFVGDHRPAWRGLLASGSAPLTTEMAKIRRRQARLVAGLLFEEGATAGNSESSGRSGSSGTGESSGAPSHSSGAASAPPGRLGADAMIADALANAINGAFEALAGWWNDHQSMSAHEVAELMVTLVGPGLGSFAGTIAGSRGSHR